MACHSLIIDGKNLVMRNFFAFAKGHLTTSGPESIETGLLHGSFLELFRLIKEYQPVQTIFCWDSPSLFRRTIHSEYKPHKLKSVMTDEQIRLFPGQMAIFREALTLLGIIQLVVDDVEGDDLVALCTIKREFRPAIVVSGDHDFWQLLRPDVSIWDPRVKRLYTLHEFEILTGFKSPTHHLAFKVFKGDQGDGVPTAIPRMKVKKAMEDAETLQLPAITKEGITGLTSIPYNGDLDVERKLARNFLLVSLHAALIVQSELLWDVKFEKPERCNWEKFIQFCQKYELKLVGKAFVENQRWL